LSHSKVSQNGNGDSSILAPTVTVGVDDSCIGRKREELLDDFVLWATGEIITFLDESLPDKVVVGDLDEGKGCENSVNGRILLAKFVIRLVLRFEIHLQNIPDEELRFGSFRELRDESVILDHCVDDKRNDGEQNVEKHCRQ
ncbi:hypothetical protein PFISCL1PPCAC_14004, partial [Pristionchus fissidentatus]